MMAWGSTPSKANQIVYFSDTGDPGIYLTNEGSTDAGPKLVPTQSYDHVFRIEYLPDGSGFVYTITTSPESSDVFVYNFGTATSAQLTTFSKEYARDFTISPDGKQIVFERAPDELLAVYGGVSDLWIMGIDGSNPQLLVAQAGHPTWSLGPIKMPTISKSFLPFLRR